MKKSIFKSSSFKFTLGLIAGMLIAILIIIPVISNDNIYSQIEKYQNVFYMAVKDYFEDVDVVKLNEGAIRGMLQELDPHSAYITAKDMKEVNEQMAGSFEGVGVSFDVVADTIIIEQVIAGGPSEKVGLEMRDRIVKVNGDDVVGISRDSVPKLLRGPKGTVVNISVARPGKKGLMEFSIVRDKIPLYAIHSHFIIQGTDIGYIRLGDYNKQSTHRELVEAGQKLREQGMKKLILDLR